MNEQELLERAVAAIKEDPALQLSLLQLNKHKERIAFLANNNKGLYAMLAEIIRDTALTAWNTGYSVAALKYGNVESPLPWRTPDDNDDEQNRPISSDSKQTTDIPSPIEEVGTTPEREMGESPEDESGDKTNSPTDGKYRP